MELNDFLNKSKVEFSVLHEEDAMYVRFDGVIDLLNDYKKQLRIGVVSQQRELLEAYTQFLWTQHNNLTDADNNKLALEKFIASYSG